MLSGDTDMCEQDRFSAGLSVYLLIIALIALGTTANAQSAPERQATFTKDVAPILQRSCQTCHRPQSIAPMSLLTFEEVRPWAKAIRLRVTNREMPPWLVERDSGVHHNRFKNSRALSDADIATLAAWVDAGSPLGNPADMPP